MTTNRVIAIDPPGCGCTECIIGEYIPLDQASARQVARMFTGDLSDHTSQRFWVDTRWTSDTNGGWSPLLRGSVEKVTISCGPDPDSEATYTWDVTDYIDVSHALFIRR